MIGTASALGAVTLVNAIACGKGATIGLSLPTEARVTVEQGKGPWSVSLNGRRPDSTLAIETVRRSMRSLGEDASRFHGSIETTTRVPVGVGLKTSSSSSVAIALAVRSAFGLHSFSRGQVLQCSASASLASGVSLTGAMDDAASCLLGGVNFTDNTSARLLRSTRLGQSFDVLIRVPGERSRRGAVPLARAKKFSILAESIFRIGWKGEIWKAMTLNGLLYSSLYGYRSQDALVAFRYGALAAGLSGTGPAVAAVFDGSGDTGGLEEVWSGDGAQVIRCRTDDGGATLV